jgi:hypothetical protein
MCGWNIIENVDSEMLMAIRDTGRREMGRRVCETRDGEMLRESKEVGWRVDEPYSRVGWGRVVEG